MPTRSLLHAVESEPKLLAVIIEMCERVTRVIILCLLPSCAKMHPLTVVIWERIKYYKSCK